MIEFIYSLKVLYFEQIYLYIELIIFFILFFD